LNIRAIGVCRIAAEPKAGCDDVPTANDQEGGDGRRRIRKRRCDNVKVDDANAPIYSTLSTLLWLLALPHRGWSDMKRIDTIATIARHSDTVHMRVFYEYL
jgi:hypothetical protein